MIKEIYCSQKNLQNFLQQFENILIIPICELMEIKVMEDINMKFDNYDYICFEQCDFKLFQVKMENSNSYEYLLSKNLFFHVLTLNEHVLIKNL